MQATSFSLFANQKITASRRKKPNCSYTYYSIPANFVPDFLQKLMELAFRYKYQLSNTRKISLEWLIVVKRENGTGLNCRLAARDNQCGKIREASLDIKMDESKIAALKEMGILCYIKKVNLHDDYCTINLLVNGKKIHATYYRTIPERCGNVQITDTIIINEWWLMNSETMKLVSAELENIFSH